MSAERRPRARPRTPGRPRSVEADQAVLSAARALFEKGGYPAATIEAISARSGVAKTTIYRRWPNRAALVVDLLMQLAQEVAPPPAGRDPLAAIHKEMRLVAEAGASLPGKILGALLSEAQFDPDLREALRTRLFEPRRKATAAAIKAAQDEGELRHGVAPLVAVDMLFGPIFYKLYIRQEYAGRAYVDQVFDAVLAGIGTERKRGSRS